MLYPFGGLITGVCVGRHKTIIASLFSFWLALIFWGDLYYHGLGVLYNKDESKDVHVINVVGVDGFQANVVQFGLDQLVDASSEDLNIFLH